MNQDLVREMFSLLYRQYNGIGEVSPLKMSSLQIPLSLCTVMFYYMAIGFCVFLCHTLGMRTFISIYLTLSIILFHILISSTETTTSI